jgi:hypothetical protein
MRGGLRFLTVNLLTRHWARRKNWTRFLVIGTTLLFVVIVVLYIMRDRPFGY